MPQSASVRDNETVEEVLEKAEAVGALPEEFTADTLYGSDANVRLCEARGVALISPVGGRTPQEDAKHNPHLRREGEAQTARRATGAPGNRGVEAPLRAAQRHRRGQPNAGLHDRLQGASGAGDRCGQHGAAS